MSVQLRPRSVIRTFNVLTFAVATFAVALRLPHDPSLARLDVCILKNSWS
ncbi:MAG: hypothetical protein M3R30_10900 [Candidatus Eremiobacteraeota bacterium]|nr:hypothetical protein [Candidatus Eremiobacteraeota bacterium]